MVSNIKKIHTPERQYTLKCLLNLLKFNTFMVYNTVIESLELSLIILMIFDLQIYDLWCFSVKSSHVQCLSSLHPFCCLAQ